MEVHDFDSLIPFIANLSEARAFDVDTLGLHVRLENDNNVVVGAPLGQVALHRNDRGHDQPNRQPSIRADR